MKNNNNIVHYENTILNNLNFSDPKLGNFSNKKNFRHQTPTKFSELKIEIEDPEEFIEV